MQQEAVLACGAYSGLGDGRRLGLGLCSRPLAQAKLKATGEEMLRRKSLIPQVGAAHFTGQDTYFAKIKPKSDSHWEFRTLSLHGELHSGKPPECHTDTPAPVGTGAACLGSWVTAGQREPNPGGVQYQPNSHAPSRKTGGGMPARETLPPPNNFSQNQ